MQWWIIPPDIIVKPMVSGLLLVTLLFYGFLVHYHGFRTANKLSLWVTSKSTQYNSVPHHGRVNTSKVIVHISGVLTHWGPVTHICINKLTRISSENDLSPDRCQASIWTNARILLIEPSGTNFSEILLKMHQFSFQKMHLKISR